MVLELFDANGQALLLVVTMRVLAVLLTHAFSVRGRCALSFQHDIEHSVQKSYLLDTASTLPPLLQLRII